MSGNLLQSKTFGGSQEQSSFPEDTKNLKQNTIQQFASINILNQEGQCIGEELVILEFQGDFEHSESIEYDNFQLGQLREVSQGNYEFKVGNHMLKGKSSDLQKPLLMTEKIINEDTQEIEFIIKAVIKKKVLFGSRPTPLRTHVRGANSNEAGGTKMRKIN